MAAPAENTEIAKACFKAFRAHDEAWWGGRHRAGLRAPRSRLGLRGARVEGIRKLADALDPGIADMALPIEHAVAEGDLVLIHLRVKGTHGGDLMGIAPTGKAIDIGVMDLFRFEGDKLVEHWVLLDNLGLLKQLGVTAI